ncbi:glycoside hydrolase domain-containing protein [Streptomyces sp. NPDC007025]|uniref:glycoside hydrolase domain-containing protein n=1 Tax=Streptomyces sp. NPDC007025 TaxID=3364771 RepID=UPI0036BF719E
MATKNQMMRRAALLSAALATVLTGGAVPASGAEPAPPDSAAYRPAAPAPYGTPSDPAPGGGAPTPGEPGASREPRETGEKVETGEAGSEPGDSRGLDDPAAPDAPADPGALGAGPGDQPSLVRGDPRDFGAQIFRGNAFDTCQAPSADTMRAWHGTSPFGAVGVYIGGRGRACPKQKHLSPDWVRTVDQQGWKLMPVYVGSQAPCVIAKNKRRFRMSDKDPYGQGKREGLDAVRQAEKLGMGRNSAVYLDMEAYRYKQQKCADTTLRFIQGWNSAVRAEGYVAGFYSSADFGVAHLEKARAAGARGLPSAVWFARWRTEPSIDGERNLDPQAWQPHRRIHQHTGNVKRTYGGHTVHIDENLVDAPVAVVG